MKILHSADWHLDSPLQGRNDAATAELKAAMLALPGQVVAAAKGCDLMLLAGDLFDGPASPQSIRAVKEALKDAGMPVFISPGNHDYLGGASPWLTEVWPENVHIFTSPRVESVAVPGLDCRVYGAGFTAARMEPLLAGFRAEQEARYALGVFHGDPTQSSSPYSAVTADQIRACGLQYLALGHIHKAGQLRVGATLCGWPGCPMGRGFDETEEKGVYIVTLEESCALEFLPLDTPRFYDWSCAPDALEGLLPAVGNRHHYRITLTGEWETPDLGAIRGKFPQFPNLLLRDATVPPLDLWASAGEDSLEGVYFTMLKEAMGGPEESRVALAARISRQLLLGQEVELP